MADFALGSLKPRGTRRVVYCSDPSNTTRFMTEGRATPDDLRGVVRNYAAAQAIDTVVQEVFSQGWSHWWRGESCEWDARPHHQRLVPMMDDGVMPIEVYVEECHRHGMELIAGFRMNDRHGHNADWFARLAKDNDVKLEIECFSTGAFWAIEKVRAGEFWVGDQRQDELGLLPDPLWGTLFFGWPGQSWTPPSAKGIQFMVDHLPGNMNWSMSCMAPEVYWSVIAHGIASGGHVRVGMEDCPYIEKGVYAQSNVQLVERAVKLATEIGREIASPEEARRITGLD
jgi:uncharacterized protein (DUF849 family)